MQPGCVGKRLLSAFLPLFCLGCRILPARLLFGAVNRALGIDADLANLALLAANGHDGLGHKPTRLELRQLRHLRGLRLIGSKLHVLITRKGCDSLGHGAVASTDLNELRLAEERGLNVRLDLGGVAGRVGALCGIWATASLSCWLLVAARIA